MARQAASYNDLRECVRANGMWGAYVSFSGGKDSTVLLHIARDVYPDIPAVFIDTGLEYPEIRQFAKSFLNVKVIYPLQRFNRVISKYGYPLIGKMASHNIGIFRRNPNGNIAKNVFDPEKKGPYAMAKWSPIAKIDFCVSEKCCDLTKKEPAHRYSEQTGRIPITAQMACESKVRTSNWIAHGCNAFDCERPISNPMSIWTDQDVLLYIKKYKNEMVRWRIENIEELYNSPLESIVDSDGTPIFQRDQINPICEVYGEIVYDCQDPEQERITDATDLRLKTTGCSRTGCMFCGFGAHLEKGETRFQRLARTHPKQYEYCIGGGGEYDPVDGLWKPNKKGLGLGHVFDELNKVYGENFLRYKPIVNERTESNE